MKKLFLLCTLAALCGGCIDKDYDLTKINTDNITIGNDDSEFVLPLATIAVSMDQLQSGTSDIQSIFEEVDVWIPTSLPEEAEYVDLVRMHDDGAYLDAMIDSLFEEMEQPASPKMDAVADLLWRMPNYREKFEAQLPVDDDSEEEFKTVFKTVFVQDNILGNVLRTTTRELATQFLPSIRFEPVHFDAPLNLSTSMIDLLTKDLDTEGATDAVNTISLFGSVQSEFPVGFSVDPVFSGSGISVDLFEIEPDVNSDIPETHFHAEGIKSLMNSFALDVTFSPLRYYPGEEFTSEDAIRMRLRLRKTGGLSFAAEEWEAELGLEN